MPGSYMNQSTQFVGSSQKQTAAPTETLMGGPENSTKGRDRVSVDRASKRTSGHQMDMEGEVA